MTILYGYYPIIAIVKLYGKNILSNNMNVLYPNACYNEVCYRGTALNW